MSLSAKKETLDRSAPEYWRLEHLKKYSSRGVTRAVPPRVTIRRAAQKMSAAGITRVADITLLDRLGIPNFMSVRPNDLGPGISYYNGKGTTRSDAHAGALMEAIERHAGETCDYEIICGTYNNLSRHHSCVYPPDVIVPGLREYDESLQLEWVRGCDLLNDEPVLVPLNFVVSPYRPGAGAHLFYSSTNGLASGNSLTEALCHALCEVIERDAESMSLSRTNLASAVQMLMNPGAGGARKRDRNIALDSLPARANPLLRRMKHAGLKVILQDVTAETRIATIRCTIVDPAWSGPLNAHGGCGAHPDARVALLRALTEAAQSRLTCIQGGREDLLEIMENKEWVDQKSVESLRRDAETVLFSAVPSREHDYIDDDVRYMFEHLSMAGLNQVIAVDLTHRDVQMPVVRVVIPKAETWAVFHVHTGRGVLGARGAEALFYA